MLVVHFQGDNYYCLVEGGRVYIRKGAEDGSYIKEMVKNPKFRMVVKMTLEKQYHKRVDIEEKGICFYDRNKKLVLYNKNSYTWFDLTKKDEEILQKLYQ